MKVYTYEEMKKILKYHKKWLNNEEGGQRADLQRADLQRADLQRADLQDANLQHANLQDANLQDAYLQYAYLQYAFLKDANLQDANLQDAYLQYANLQHANLQRADLQDAFLRGADLQRADLQDAFLRGTNLQHANLQHADLRGANLQDANLQHANLTDANLDDARGLIKPIGAYPGNFYWKRFCKGLINNDYQFFVGLNELREGEKFSDDVRKTCTFPGFHFASRSWCAVNYYERPLEALIQIPFDAKINEPWATDGKASADKIIIVQVFDVESGKDVTSKFLRPNKTSDDLASSKK